MKKLFVSWTDNKPNSRTLNLGGQRQRGSRLCLRFSAKPEEAPADTWEEHLPEKVKAGTC